MIPTNLKRALIANEPKKDSDGEIEKTRVAEIWFVPEDEEDIKRIIGGRSLVIVKVMR